MSGTIYNWSKLYAADQLDKWELPVVGKLDTDNGIYRHPLVSRSQLPKGGSDSPLWYIVCDVLDLSEDILTDNTAMVFARRIEISNSATLQFNRTDGNTQDIFILAQEVVDKKTGAPTELTVQTINDNEVVKTEKFAGGSATTDGINSFYWPSNASSSKQVSAQTINDSYGTELAPGQPLCLGLMTIFQLATLLSTEHQTLSIAQFKWVAAVAKVAPASSNLAIQASSMAMTQMALQAATEKNALLVPRLDTSIYAAQAKDFLGLLNTRAAEWQNIQNQVKTDKHWETAVKTSIQKDKVNVSLAQKLLDQAKKTRDQVIDARNIAVNQVVAQQAEVVNRKIKFDRGIKDWEATQTFKASLNLITGVVDVLTQIPAIIAAPETAIVPATKLGAEVVKDSVLAIQSSAVKSTLGDKESQYEDASKQHFKAVRKDAQQKIRDALKKINDAKTVLGPSIGDDADGAVKVTQAAVGIWKVSDAADNMETQSQSVLDATQAIGHTALSSIALGGVDVVDGGAHAWQLLREAVDQVFTGITELTKVGGGLAYQLAIQELVTYGETYSKARVAAAKANAHVAELNWRLNAAKNVKKVDLNSLDAIGNEIARDQAYAQLAFNRMVNSKRSIYLALEAYRRAFIYFTLADEADAPSLPKITDSIAQFRSAVANKTNKALLDTALNPVPSTMRSAEVNITDPNILDQLKSSGYISFEIKSSNVAFNDHARIRFKSVKVYAVGLKTHDEISVKIATSGVYTDKVPGSKNLSRFVGPKSQLTFTYQLKKGSSVGTGDSDYDDLFSADIAPRYVNDFFWPTPFTIWTLRLVSQNRSKLDLSQLTGLKVIFGGNASSSN